MNFNSYIIYSGDYLDSHLDYNNLFTYIIQDFHDKILIIHSNRIKDYSLDSYFNDSCVNIDLSFYEKINKRIFKEDIVYRMDIIHVISDVGLDEVDYLDILWKIEEKLGIILLHDGQVGLVDKRDFQEEMGFNLDLDVNIVTVI